MTNEIPKQEWKQFFDDLSRLFLEWQTRVEVLKDDIGAQVLTDGLPLVGFAFEQKTGGGAGESQSSIEIILGEESGVHQTHTVSNPRAVFFLPKDETPAAMSDGGTIEIEDAAGAKTLVYLVEPVSVLIVYAESEEILSAA